MPDAMIIRKAVLKDAVVIADFNLRLGLESEGLRLNPKTVAKGVRALLRSPAKGTYFLAECALPDGKQEIAGQLMITLEWSDWRNGTFWWIQSVYVRKEFRGRGVFRKLYRHVLRLARKDRNVCALRLYVEKENRRAFRTYQKLGMKETYYRIFDYSIFGGHAG
jgi:GNAT superfamily N-acetyltransferase